jgi:hypothetical protein
MEIKTISKTSLRNSLRQLHSQAAQIYAAIVSSDLPHDEELENMKDFLGRGISDIREAERGLGRVEGDYNEAFEPIDPPDML